jgi:hypothetical protein
VGVLYHEVDHAAAICGLHRQRSQQHSPVETADDG